MGMDKGDATRRRYSLTLFEWEFVKENVRISETFVEAVVDLLHAAQYATQFPIAGCIRVSIGLHVLEGNDVPSIAFARRSGLRGSIVDMHAILVWDRDLVRRNARGWMPLEISERQRGGNRC